MEDLSFEDTIYYKFKKIYNINLSKDKNIKINGMIFPNYAIINKLNIFKENYNFDVFEYCRIINKIFGLKNSNGLSYYETCGCSINKNDIVFDCGANTGIFSLYASYKANSVYSFEPLTAIRHYLKNTIEYNNNIKMIPFGLSDSTKEEIFSQTDNPGASRSIKLSVPPYHKILYYEKVKLISIDDFVKSTNIIPTFIKMDIENGEVAAVEGAKETINKYAPKFSISIHELNIDKKNYLKSLFNNKYFFIEKSEEFYDDLLICIPIGENKNG